MSDFLEDDPELAAFGEDLDWPPRLDGNGDLGTVRGLDNLQAALTGRAITAPGEIPHREKYGTEWEDLKGAPAVEQEFTLYQARLLEQYQREDRLQSVTVTITSEDSDVIGRVRGLAKTGDPVGTDLSLRTA